MRSLRRLAIVLIAAAITVWTTAVATAESTSSWAWPQLAPERKEALIESLRPWFELLNEVFSQPFAGPFLSIGFFLMILTFAKRSK